MRAVVCAIFGHRFTLPRGTLEAECSRCRRAFRIGLSATRRRLDRPKAGAK